MLLGKLILAAVALVALVSFPMRELIPGISWVDLVLYCVAGLAGVLVVLLVLVVCSLQISQCILRNGGTDAQWFWFSGEPRGLAALRKGQRVDKDAL